MGLKDVKEWLHYCGRCNSCKITYRQWDPSCPAFEKFKFEPYTSSGKVWLARDLLEGKFPLSESVRDKIFSCTLCGSCSEQCQQLISDHHQDIFEALREECADAGLLYPPHQAIKNNEHTVHNPYGDLPETRFAGIDDKYFKSSADVWFFVGCTTALRNKEFFNDILTVLTRLNVNFTLSREEWCCGSPLLTTGQKKDATELAEHNAALIAKLGIKTVVTACAGCYRTLKRQYPEKFGLLKDGTVKIQHLTEFLADALKKKDFKPNLPKISVTYHDPCHLGRHVGIYDEPRKIITSIPHVQLVEMPRNKGNAWCCGAGAGVKSAFKDWAVEISVERIKEALALNQKITIPLRYLLSACPFCERNLSDALDILKKADYPGAAALEVLDILQFVKQTLNSA